MACHFSKKQNRHVIPNTFLRTMGNNNIITHMLYYRHAVIKLMTHFDFWIVLISVLISTLIMVPSL
jgi:hypothetical protein